MLQKLLLFCIVFSIVGCVSTLTPIKTGLGLSVQPGEGLLLIAVDSEIDLESIRIRGEKRVALSNEEFKGRKFFLVSLPAGDYRFSEISVKIVFTVNSHTLEERISFKLSKLRQLEWDFKVIPGKTAYAGELRIDDVVYGYGFPRAANIDLVNRSSLAYIYMQENHPQILQQFQMNFTGFGEDPFFEHIYELKKNHESISEAQ